MKNTTNYNLSLYEASDKFCITSPSNSFNQNMKIIDGKLREIANIAIQSGNREFPIDDTLSLYGTAADSKTVGDKISELQQEIDSLKEIIKNLQTNEIENYD